MKKINISLLYSTVLTNKIQLIINLNESNISNGISQLVALLLIIFK